MMDARAAERIVTLAQQAVRSAVEAMEGEGSPDHANQAWEDFVTSVWDQVRLEVADQPPRIRHG